MDEPFSTIKTGNYFAGAALLSSADADADADAAGFAALCLLCFFLLTAFSGAAAVELAVAAAAGAAGAAAGVCAKAAPMLKVVATRAMISLFMMVSFGVGVAFLRGHITQAAIFLLTREL